MIVKSQWLGYGWVRVKIWDAGAESRMSRSGSINENQMLLSSIPNLTRCYGMILGYLLWPPVWVNEISGTNENNDINEF
jgi:hypothetical protein